MRKPGKPDYNENDYAIGIRAALGLETSDGEHYYLFEEALRICVEMKRASTFSAAATSPHRLWSRCVRYSTSWT